MDFQVEVNSVFNYPMESEVPPAFWWRSAMVDEGTRTGGRRLNDKMFFSSLFSKNIWFAVHEVLNTPLVVPGLSRHHWAQLCSVSRGDEFGLCHLAGELSLKLCWEIQRLNWGLAILVSVARSLLSGGSLPHGLVSCLEVYQEHLGQNCWDPLMETKMN